MAIRPAQDTATPCRIGNGFEAGYQHDRAQPDRVDRPRRAVPLRPPPPVPILAAPGRPCGGWRMKPHLAKRSFSLAGHRTSVALEPAFWAVLDRVAAARATSVAALVAELDAARDPDVPLASTLRVFALGSRQPG
jgi:hypothetical protein